MNKARKLFFVIAGNAILLITLASPFLFRKIDYINIMLIRSINPDFPQPERDRRGYAVEILQDEAIIAAILEGAEKYKAELQRGASGLAEEGIVSDPTKTHNNIRLLEEFVKSGLYKDLPKQAESMQTTLRGDRVGRVILGSRVPMDGTPIKQMEIRAQVASRASEEESAAAKSFRGNSPEDIIVNQGVFHTPIKLSISIKEVAYTPDKNGIEVQDTAGICLSLTPGGQIVSVQGLSFKHGVPHFTDNLLSDETMSETLITVDTQSNINQFVE